VFENHAQDSRVREMPDVSPTQGAQLCNAPANNPLLVAGFNHATRFTHGAENPLREDFVETSRSAPAGEGAVVENLQGEYVVRRLTPRECERLQGFPDDWTRIPYRGKPAEECPDGPRYKAMGNSWGTNCAEWILRRLLAARHVWHPEQDEPSTTERIP